MTDRLTRLFLIWMLVLATLWIGADYVRWFLFAADQPQAIAPRGELADFERVTIEVFEASAPAVAFVYSERAPSRAPGSNGLPAGTGSGIVWDAAGHIVTNFHVVDGASRILVRFGADDAMTAVLVGVAPDYDLAVLRLVDPPVGLQTLPIGSSADLKVGQTVFAIGNPFGLDRSLSSGIVSALDRHLPTESGREIRGVIQTDAAINPGNSGGPLLDSAGRLIGVNTAIISGTGSYAGIGFAVPVDVVNEVVPQLIRDGRVPRMGIGISVLSQEFSAGLGVGGLVIADISPGTPAARAGLAALDQQTGRLGDIIIAANGQPVRTLSDFVGQLESVGIGNEIELTVVRNGRRRSVAVEVTDIAQ